MPCYKLALRFGRDDIIKKFLASGRSGFYLSVIEPGSVAASSEIEVLSRDPNCVSVADIARLYFGPSSDEQLLERVARLTALPENWKAELLLRSQTHNG